MDLNTHPLKVDSDGIYLTRLTQNSICDYCGAQRECKVKETVSPASRCPIFVPILAFSPVALRGLEGRFSTFRSSFIWSQRAQWVQDTGGRVAIVNSGEKSLVAFAKITDVIVGPALDLLTDHAKTNHLLLGSGVSDADAPKVLRQKIRNLAGSRYIKSDTQTCSVIYVQIEEEPPNEIACVA